MSCRSCGSVNDFNTSHLFSSSCTSVTVSGLLGLEEASLLDELGGGVGDLVDDGLGHLLHPLGQLKLGHGAGIGVDQVGEKRTVFLVALVLNKNICSLSRDQNDKELRISLSII